MVLGALALAFVLSPVATNAQTVDELLAQIKSLQSQIQILQLQNQILTLQFKIMSQPCQQPGAIYNYLTGQSCTTQAPSITVVSPNGGESWMIGTQQSIVWSAKNVPANMVVNIALVSDSKPSPSYYTLFLNLPPDLKGGASWIVGNAYRDARVPAGLYQMSVCLGDPKTGSEICDRSDSYFKIYDAGTTNKPPSITGVSGPTTLEVGKSGTWSVTASDPENGSLSYSVVWGDEGGTTAASPTVSQVQQTATFTHTYSRSGTFYPTFTVTDNSGQSARTSLSVVVGTTNAITGTLSAKLSSNSPANRTLTISPATVTPDIVLGIFSLEAQKMPVTINTLIFKLAGTNSYSSATTLYENARLVDNSGRQYSATSLSYDGTVTFANLNIKLPQDQWQDFSFKVDIPAGIQTGSIGQVLLAASNDTIKAIDTNYNIVQVIPSMVISNQTTFLTGSVPPPVPTLTASTPPNSAVDARDGSGFSFKLAVLTFSADLGSDWNNLGNYG